MSAITEQDQKLPIKGIIPLFRRLLAVERHLNDRLKLRFPKTAKRFLRWLFDKFLTNPAMAIVLPLVLVPLTLTEGIRFVSSVSLWLAWFIVIVWVANSPGVNRLPITRRAIVVLSSGFLLFLSFRFYLQHEMTKYAASHLEIKPEATANDLAPTAYQAIQEIVHKEMMEIAGKNTADSRPNEKSLKQMEVQITADVVRSLTATPQTSVASKSPLEVLTNAELRGRLQNEMGAFGQISTQWWEDTTGFERRIFRAELNRAMTEDQKKLAIEKMKNSNQDQQLKDKQRFAAEVTRFSELLILALHRIQTPLTTDDQEKSGFVESNKNKGILDIVDSQGMNRATMLSDYIRGLWPRIS